MRAATDVLTVSSSSSHTESLACATAHMEGVSCPPSSITAAAATATASCDSPRTPKGTPPSSAKRCFVRPLLLQQRHSASGVTKHQHRQPSGAPNPCLVTLCKSEEEGSSGAEKLATEPKRLICGVVSGRCPGTAATPVADDEDARKLVSGAVTEKDGEGNRSRHSSDDTAGGGRCPAIHPHSDHRTAATPSGATHDQQGRRQVTAFASPITSAPTRGDGLAKPSPAARPSSLSMSTVHNSSASSSFHGTPASAPRAAGTGRSPAGGAPLSSLALPHGTPSCNGNSYGSGSSAEAKAAPLLLRTWLSVHAIGEELDSPATSRSTSRNPVSGPSFAALQPPLGPLLPGGTASAGSVTSLSSNRSSAHPSFLRPPSVTHSSGASAAQANGEHRSLNIHVGVRPMRSGGDNSSPTGGIVHAVNGRVVCSPHGARRPDLSARRTTFQRSTSNLSLREASSSRGPPLPSDLKASSSDVAATQGTALARLPAPTQTEMHSFILGQYRTFQRDVLSHPAAPLSVDADVTAVSFQHVERTTCPKHSKAAKKALLRAQEELRLRALQQQHHDMEVIRNGGREHIGKNMKSSAMLAGTLSKLRARTRSSLGSSSSSTAAERPRGSMEWSTSENAALAASVATSFVGSPDECNATALCIGNTCSYAAHETNDAAQSRTPKRELEAWHVSKAFMASDAPADARQYRQQARNVNKNGMKGEEIVMDIVFDSEDGEDADASSTSSTETLGRSRVGQLQRSAHLAPVDSADFTRYTAAKCAGERLVSQPQRRGGAAASVRRSAHPLHNSSSDSASSEESYFSLTKHRASGVRHTPPLPSTLPLELDSHHRTNAATASRAHGSSERDDDGDTKDRCCHCCPCKRPKSVLALCRTNSHSAASTVRQEEEHSLVVGDIDEEKHFFHRLAAPAASATAMVDRQSYTAMSCANSGGSSFVVEDLEGSDEDEPTLSMQSFRRANIQRIR
ncbi:hypothetical protein LSCM4_00804 [Leishmania orientalis]|uniref:Uncharacterized protein n=1 Tax=Leishmania orientalis TaxID=2249476 RepID=A0A836GZQ6_9TRYP|nr:hypothetical protein LSCM4_00804 [Leishmania orientalis]